MDKPSEATTLLICYLRQLHRKADIKWTDANDAEARRFVDLLLDAALEESRNERKGLAGDNRRRSTAK